MKSKRINKPAPVLAGFVNNMSGEYFEAFYMGLEDIEGKAFYILKLKDHPRVVKMATSAIKKTKLTVDSLGKR